MNTSEVLNRAADLIQSRGWTQEAKGGWFPEPNADTPVCAEGAIRLAVAEAGMWATAKTSICHALSDYLGDLYPECFNPISGRVIVFNWNDRKGRTAEQVLEAMRAAALIESARERESVSA
jgi:hypothetical protein